MLKNYNVLSALFDGHTDSKQLHIFLKPPTPQAPEKREWLESEQILALVRPKWERA